MNTILMDKIFKDTAYVRIGGSDAELRAAEYIKDTLKNMGLEAYIENFEVDMADIHNATLTIDGEDVACKGYMLCGSGEVEAPLYYLTDSDKYSLSLCRGKIVLFDGYLGYWRYRDILEAGAVGFITYDGNVNYADRDIDRRELRPFVSKGNKILGVNINAKDATKIVKSSAKTAKITIAQDEYKTNSRNVVLDMPGKKDEYIVFTAHYDSTPLSEGAYDNMSGSIGLIAIAEHFINAPHEYGLRFIWCGSEERGLLGSKAYCAAHEKELGKLALNINLDMIGSTMGRFIACCTSEKALVDYVSYLGLEKGFQVSPYQDVYSSDSTPFADNGVPAISFARSSPRECATIHNGYDTYEIIKLENMSRDIDFILAFTERMANAVCCPVSREIPDDVKQKLDEYLLRKRKK